MPPITVKELKALLAELDDTTTFEVEEMKIDDTSFAPYVNVRFPLMYVKE